MIVEQLTIQNFMCFQNEKIDFTKHHGITLIEGKNGDGKSSIIEALCWCFFGKTIRKLPAGDVQNEHALGERTMVYAKVRDGNRTFAIERSRLSNTPSVRLIEGEDSTADNPNNTVGVQERIEKLLGTDYNIFATSAIFGAESFCEKTDSERKAMMEKLLGHSYYSRAESLVKERRAEHGKKIATLQSKIELSASKYEQAESSIESLLEDMDTHIQRVQAKLYKARKEHSELYWDWVDTLDYVLDCKKIYREAREGQEEKYRAWLDKHKALTEDYDVKRTEVIGLREELKFAKREVDTVQAELDRLKSSQHPDECPTCGQLWKQDNEGVRKLIKKQEDVVFEKQERVAKIKTTLLKAEAAMDDAKIRKDKNEELAVAKEVKKPAEMLEAEQDLVTFRVQLNQMNKEISKIKEELVSNPYEATVARLLGEMENSEESLEQHQEDIDVLYEQDKYYAFWEESFNKKGLPSYMLDESIPILNEFSETISDILSNGQIKVVFNSDGKKRAGNAKLDIEVHSVKGGSSYVKSSKGEKRRIDLCVVLALRELIARRSTKPFDQIFMDEIFDGMDDEGSESVITLLRKYYKDKKVFVITHDDNVKSLLNSDRIVVKKVGEKKSEIKQIVDTTLTTSILPRATDIPSTKIRRKALSI